MPFPVIPIVAAGAGLTAVTGFVSNAVSSFFDMVGKEEETKKETVNAEVLSLVPAEDRSDAVAYQKGLNPNSVFQNIEGGGFASDYSQNYNPTVNDNKQYSYSYNYVLESPGTTITTDQTSKNTQSADAGSGSGLSDIVSTLGTYAPYIAVGLGAFFLVKGLGKKNNNRGYSGYRNYNRGYYNRNYYRPYNNSFSSPDGSAAYWQYRDNRDNRRFEYRMSRYGSLKNNFRKGTDYVSGSVKSLYKRGTDYFGSSSRKAADLRAKRSAETSAINGGMTFHE